MNRTCIHKTQEQATLTAPGIGILFKYYALQQCFAYLSNSDILICCFLISMSTDQKLTSTHLGFDLLYIHTGLSIQLLIALL